MYKLKTTVINNSGLHARPASKFVNLAKNYESEITIRRMDEDGDEVDAKSIVFLLSLGIGKGTEVEISAKGDDEREAVDALVALVESFDESH